MKTFKIAMILMATSALAAEPPGSGLMAIKVIDLGAATEIRVTVTPGPAEANALMLSASFSCLYEQHSVTRIVPQNADTIREPVVWPAVVRLLAPCRPQDLYIDRVMALPAQVKAYSPLLWIPGVGGMDSRWHK